MPERAGFVVVTGGAKRVGAEISRRLARDGWPVFVHVNDSLSEGRALVEEIRAAGGKAETGAIDFRDPGFASKLDGVRIGDLPWFGLVNSASLFEPDEADDFTPETLAELLRINFTAPVEMIRALAARVPDGQTGFAINITDQKVLNPNPDYFSYTLSKVALHGANDVLTQAYGAKVRVNTVVPGLMLPSGDQTAENFARVHGQTPIGAGATPADVADAVAFLAGAPHLAGVVLSVDGGQRLVRSDRDVMFK
jgi:NAD(P)-dependent dehydrogenase (short-subunit alcohol dehydrogenase family)